MSQIQIQSIYYLVHTLVVSEEDHVDIAEVVRCWHTWPSRMGHGGEQRGHRAPAIHVDHGHLVDEQDFKGHECGNLRVPGFCKVQFSLQLAIKIQQGVNSGRLDVRA